MATKKNAKVMSKEELVEKLTLEQEKAIKKSEKSSGKKPTEKALKVTKKVAKKAEKPVEEKNHDEAEKQVEKNPVKAEKAPAAKKATVKKGKKEKENPVEAEKEEKNPIDKLFPKTIEVEGTKFSRVILSSWEEFKTFVEACQEEGSTHAVIACSWPKKYKKYYNENNQGEKLFPKDGFEHDLDLQEVLMLQQTRETAITVSILTESVVLFREEYFELAYEDYFLANDMPFMAYTYEDK